jgi:hypothetical protein
MYSEPAEVNRTSTKSLMDSENCVGRVTSYPGVNTVAFLGGLEILLIKGVGYIATHMSTHTALAAAKALTHLVLSQGVVATAAALSPIAITGTVVIGGIVWTQEKANRVNKIVKALADNDAEEAGKHLLKLSGVLDLTIDDTAVKVIELLDDRYDKESVRDISKAIRAIAGEIKKSKK